MAIVTTYVCDVSGVSGTNKADFAEVVINSTTYYEYDGYGSKDGFKSYGAISFKKLVHKDVAKKLNLFALKSDELEQPEVSFEGKLKVLLTDFIDNIVNDSVSEHMSNYNSR